jgi:hypothetical protein
MPFASLQWLLPILRPESITLLKTVRPDLVVTLNEPGSLVNLIREATDALDITPSVHEWKYLEEIPLTVQEAIRAAIAMAVELDYEVHLTFKPGYVFGVGVTQWGVGHQAVTILVEGPEVSYGRTFEEQIAGELGI